jgi:hypothetical protein
MNWIFALALASATPTPVDHPKTYLASVVGIPLKHGESIESFSFSTWGARFNAVCHVPYGWTIKAGGSATPDGVLEGEGSLGSTWFNQSSPKALRGLVLVTLYDAVQRRDVGKEGGPIYIPATFKGKARLWGDEAERNVPLSYANIRLTPATRCPVAAP